MTSETREAIRGGSERMGTMTYEDAYQDSPKQDIGAVHQELARFDETILEVEKMVDHLRDRLDPVLMPSSELDRAEVAGTVPRAVPSPLTRRIEEMRGRLVVASGRLGEAMSRLEI